MQTITPMTYKQSELKPGVVHLGWGNFARAFVGEYFHDVAQAGYKDWGLVAVAPTDRQIRDIRTLQSQGNIYHLIKRNGHETCTRIGALLNIMIAQSAPRAVIERLAHEDTKIATMTITQAGYGLNSNREFANTDQLEKEAKAIANENYAELCSIPSLVTAALYDRYKNQESPFTVLSFDNLPHNGYLLHLVTQKYAKLINPGFADYISNEARFPNTVVDRVTPHQNYAVNASHLAGTYNILNDTVPVVCEPYRKLYIEDNFVDGTRPPLDLIADKKAKAEFVDNIEPYEYRKLRLLNGSHMAIGIVSKLLQVPTVLEATKTSTIRNFWLNFLEQAGDSLAPTPTSEFMADTIERLDNPHLTDQTDRLLASTTVKVPVRLFSETGLRNGTNTEASAFAIAAWIKYMTGRDESGNPFNLHKDDEGKLESLGLAMESGKISSQSIKEKLPNLLTKDETVIKSDAFKEYVALVATFYKKIHNDGLTSAMNATFRPIPNSIFNSASTPTP